MRKNQFEPLRRQGIIGEVVSKDFRSTNIFQCGYYCSVTIFTGELMPNIWAFGYHVVDGDFEAKALPGELNGWFESENDAKLYALDYLRMHSHVPENAKENIENLMYDLRNKSLYD